jgi:hypothetical protein
MGRPEGIYKYHPEKWCMKPSTPILVAAVLLALLVLAIVAVPASIYLGGGFSSLGAGSPQAQSQIYWKSMTPFAITSVKASGTTLELEILNHGQQQAMLSDILVNGKSVSPSMIPLAFSSGQPMMLIGTLPSPCGAPGTAFTLSKVMIVYSQGPFEGLYESGTEPIVGECS